jgi:acyl-CoA reductase-like NAD-dependent aldehyde dehydrogenase
MKLHDVKGPWIGGAIQAPHSAGRVTLTSPVTEQRLATAPDCDAADVDAAVQAARDALPAWARLPPAERARCLSDLAARLESADDMAELVTIENGSPITRSPVILEDADLEVFRAQLITTCLPNTGQVCYASTRLLAPRARYDEVVEATRDVLANAPSYGLSGSVFTSAGDNSKRPG